jgi:hypothetical protein
MSKTSTIALSILGAAAVGIIIGGLFYTDKGREIREQLGSKASEAKEGIADLISRGKQKATDTFNDVSQKASDKFNEVSRKANGVKTSAEDFVS